MNPKYLTETYGNSCVSEASLASGGECEPMPGSTSCVEIPAGDDQQVSLQEVHSQIEEKVGRTFESLDAISYRVGVVSCSMHYMKVKAIEEDGAESIIDAKIWDKINKLAEALSVRTDVDEDSSLEDDL